MGSRRARFQRNISRRRQLTEALDSGQLSNMGYLQEIGHTFDSFVRRETFAHDNRSDELRQASDEQVEESHQANMAGPSGVQSVQGSECCECFQEITFRVLIRPHGIMYYEVLHL